MDILVNRKKLENINRSYKNLSKNSLEVLLVNQLLDEDLDFSLRSIYDLQDKFSEKINFKFIGEIRVDYKNISIRGIDRDIKLIFSKFALRKIKEEESNEILAHISIRKNIDDSAFIENIEIIKIEAKVIYKKIIKHRSQLDSNSWISLLMNSLGYDIEKLENIENKYNLLSRLLPYVQKNFNCIELGGKSTGKSKCSEFFRCSKKISTDITFSKAIHDNNTNKYGVLFNKSVLYFDERNISDLNKDIAPSFLQAQAGGEVESHGDYESKKSTVSFVSLGNIIDGSNSYLNGRIFKDFDKGFNKLAMLDRQNFLITGWKLPEYSKIMLEEDVDVFPIIVLEEFLLYLREKNYDIGSLNLNIELLEQTSSSRFVSSITENITGLLKLIYPEGISDEINKEELETLIKLGTYGKYAIYEGLKGKEYSELKNSGVRISSNDLKFEINRKILLSEYIFDKSKDNNFETDFEFKRNNVEIPEWIDNYRNQFRSLEESYKIIMAYSQNPTKDLYKKFLEAALEIIKIFEEISNTEMSVKDCNPIFIFFKVLSDAKNDIYINPSFKIYGSRSEEIKKINYKIDDFKKRIIQVNNFSWDPKDNPNSLEYIKEKFKKIK